MRKNKRNYGNLKVGLGSFSLLLIVVIGFVFFRNTSAEDSRLKTLVTKQKQEVLRIVNSLSHLIQKENYLLSNSLNSALSRDRSRTLLGLAKKTNKKNDNSKLAEVKEISVTGQVMKDKNESQSEVLSLSKSMTKSAIKHLANLSEGQKINFANQVNDAKTIKAVNLIKEAAWAESKNNL